MLLVSAIANSNHRARTPVPAMSARYVTGQLTYPPPRRLNAVITD
jgi:hypothetical protein